jgi:hypothetical protein
MKGTTLFTISAIVILQLSALLVSFSSQAADSQGTQCQARLQAITGDHLACLLKFEAAAMKGQKTSITDKVRARCARVYQRRYDQAIKAGKAGCSGIDSSQLPIKPQLDVEIYETVTEVKALITDAPPPAQASPLPPCQYDLRHLPLRN